MSDDESSVGDNDADKRPRMYGKVVTEEGSVELTVKGSEGETSDDLSKPFDTNLQKLVNASDELSDDEEEQSKMCQ